MRDVRQRAAMDADPIRAIVRGQTAGHRVAINADLGKVVRQASAKTRKRASRNLPINRRRDLRLSLRRRRPSVPGVKHNLPQRRRRRRRYPQRLQSSLLNQSATRLRRTQKQKMRARVRAAVAVVVAAAVAATRKKLTHHKPPYPMRRSCSISMTKMPIVATLAKSARSVCRPIKPPLPGGQQYQQ